MTESHRCTAYAVPDHQQETTRKINFDGDMVEINFGNEGGRSKTFRVHEDLITQHIPYFGTDDAKVYRKVLRDGSLRYDLKEAWPKCNKAEAMHNIIYWIYFEELPSYEASIEYVRVWVQTYHLAIALGLPELEDLIVTKLTDDFCWRFFFDETKVVLKNFMELGEILGGIEEICRAKDTIDNLMGCIAQTLEVADIRSKEHTKHFSKQFLADIPGFIVENHFYATQISFSELQELYSDKPEITRALAHFTGNKLTHVNIIEIADGWSRDVVEEVLAIILDQDPDFRGD